MTALKHALRSLCVLRDILKLGLFKIDKSANKTFSAAELIYMSTNLKCGQTLNRGFLSL